MLAKYGWFTKPLHGSKYQSGMPDLFACHKVYGIRLIEVKLPGFQGSKFTAAQLKTFPQLIDNGADVWILTGAKRSEYNKLFKKGNYWFYLNHVLHKMRRPRND
jgi:hypothetical protein